MDKETYTMEFACHNCETRFDKEIPRGASVDTVVKKCPYCGKEGVYGFGSHKPKQWGGVPLMPINIAPWTGWPPPLF